MDPRIFISYRTADGSDKATALARDLGAVFGDAQVFLDKDDLRGGSVWRREVSRTLEQRPVLLLLVTPQLFGAVDGDGRRRIDDPGDPVRREVESALEHGAELIPVLCDGVDAVPAGLPPPFDHLQERTWRRLRAYDWAGDLARLVGDLRATGIAPLSTGRGRRRGLLAVGAAVAVGALATAWFKWRRPARDWGRDLSGDLSGEWQADFADGESVRWVLTQDGEQLRFESHPIDVRERPDWVEYRAFWRRREGRDLDAVRYRGEGIARATPGSPLTLEVNFELFSVPGDVPVDGGGLSATLSPDGDRLAGTRWLNSTQAKTPFTMVRAR